MNKEYIEKYLLHDVEKLADNLNQININGAIYQLEERIVYNDLITIKLPSNFIVMSEDQVSVKYPSVNHPDIIYTNEDASIDFTFTYTDIPIDNAQIKECILGFRTILKRMNPTYQFQKINVFLLNDVMSIGKLKYSSLALDGDVFNMLYVVPVFGNLLIGTFSCVNNDRERNTLLMNTVVNSISEVDNKKEDS